MTALHVVYRSSGKENAKPRPGFYSKALALASFLRAAEQCDQVANVVFLNDVPIDPGIVEMMRPAGEVLQHGEMTLARSYREAVVLPGTRRWPADDFVYLAEDDYLFTPEAFTSLMGAAEAIPEASYFSFYASEAPASKAAEDEDPATAAPNASGWRMAETTTSSFGARISALAADRWLHLLGCRAQGAFDNAICLAYSGVPPYRWSEVVRTAGGGPNLKTTAARSVARAALNLAAYASRRRPRLLLTRFPSLATHMEEPHMRPDVDWAEVAADTVRWADAKGLRLGPGAMTP